MNGRHGRCGRHGGYRRLCLTVLFAWLLAPITSRTLVCQSVAPNLDVAVIVNPNNPVSNISLSDLKKIFSGEKHSWPGGAAMKPIVRAPGSHERIALLRMLGMSESEYKQYWTAQVFREAADAEPMTVPSFGMMKEAMQAFPGAIGMVDAQNLKPGMKVLKVDGREPGESGYPIH
jgi:ABC-type phosphate transport system substrate-binding protein